MASTTRITVIVGEIDNFTSGIVRKLTTEITANLIEDTPVDTSWARVNWVPNIGAPNETPASGKPTTSMIAAAAATQQASIAKLITYKIKSGPVYVSNNVPYIGRLNNGSSKQAPRAYVQAAVRKGISKVTRSK